MSCDNIRYKKAKIRNEAPRAKASGFGSGILKRPKAYPQYECCSFWPRTYKMIGFKECQILLFIFILISLVGVLGVALSNMWQLRFAIQPLDRNSLIAFYAAQAGLERGKLYALTGETPGGGSQYLPCDSDSNPSCWYQDLPGAWYKFRADGSSNNRNVYAKGRTIDSANVTLAQRNLQVQVDVNPPSSAQHNVDSWKEW